MRATDLDPEIWNQIYRHIAQSQQRREVTIGTVTKRDAVKKLIWLEEFGDTAIPLVSHDYTFTYYDTNELGVSVKRGDPDNPVSHVEISTPKLGAQVVVLKPLGNLRFPMCLGEIQSEGIW